MSIQNEILSGKTVEDTNASSISDAREILVASGMWVFCSIGMMLFNKLAVTAFPLACTLVVTQCSVTVLLMLVFGWSSLHIGSWYDVLRWSAVAPFFAGVLLTSMFALHNAPMSLVIVFRGLAPIFGMAAEMFYPTPYKLTVSTVATLVMLIFGILLYLLDLESGNFAAIGWVLLNNFFVVGDRLLQRLMLSKDQCPVDISKASVTLLNNLLGGIIILIAAFVANEYPKIPATISGLKAVDIAWVSLSCVVGCGIAYTGIWTQSLINATSFLVMATANKFFVILIGVFIMKDGTLTHMQFVGATITIVAGVLYGKVREGVELEEKLRLKSLQAAIHETTPLLNAKLP